MPDAALRLQQPPSRRAADAPAVVGGGPGGPSASSATHDSMVTIAVDGLDQQIDIRAPGPLRFRPGGRIGIRVTGEAGLHEDTP